MKMSDAQATADWELGKLVHDLDMLSNARMRERVSELGLTVAQASALRELTGPMTMSELAGRMSCEPSNATVVIDNLENQQLIERRPHPSDRRAKQLILTNDGAALRKRLLKTLGEEPLLTGLTPQELDELRRLLQRALADPGSPRT
jgi:MarR family transcriptional regulator, organic hydroperoxide resistance regulator